MAYLLIATSDLFAINVHQLTPPTWQWRHNGRDRVSNRQPHDCLLSRLIRRRSKETSKLRVTGLCAGKSPGSGEFPAQMASNAIFFSFDDVIINMKCAMFVRENHIKCISLPAGSITLDENITTYCFEDLSSNIVNTLKTTLRVMAGGCVRYNYLRIWHHNSDSITINDIPLGSTVLDIWLMSCINLFGWSLCGKCCVPWSIHKAQWYWFRLMPVKDTSFLHAKPWIPGGEKSIFTVVIH